MVKKDNLVAIIGIIVSSILGVLFAWSIGNGSFQSSATIPIVFAYTIQIIAFVPAFILKTEKFYDLIGGLTYVLTINLALFLSSSISWISTLISLMVTVWAVRLAFYLFRRVHKQGKDRRFDSIKHSFLRFLMAWVMQGLWVTFTSAAALSAIYSSDHANPNILTYVGILIWVIGFSTEWIADLQKSKFKNNTENNGKFIQEGLWSISRHPNYLGEIILWTGIAMIALPIMDGWQFLTLSSPLFVFLLLSKISGIPILEKQADSKWGGSSEYEIYKKQTPVLFPRLSKRYNSFSSKK